MRLDLVTEQETRAILGAVTHWSHADLPILAWTLFGFELAFHHVMVARQNHYARGRLGDGRVQIVGCAGPSSGRDDEDRVVRREAAAASSTSR